MTVRLPQRESSREKPPSGATWLALIFLLVCAGGLIALTSLILPQIRGVIFVVCGMGGFVALHYFTWGHWLTRNLQEDRELAEFEADEGR